MNLVLLANSCEDFNLRDYSPGGMVMPERNFSHENYGFGFNGKIKEDEIKGIGNSYDYGLREYDPRTAKFWSTEPLAQKFPHWSPYHFSGLNPIKFNDLDGAEPFDPFYRFFTTDASITLVQKPNSLKSKVYGSVIGVTGSLSSVASGALNLIQDPIESGKGIMRSMSQNPIERAVDVAMNMTNRYGDLPQGVQEVAVYSHLATDLVLTLAPLKFKTSTTIASEVSGVSTTLGIPARLTRVVPANLKLTTLARIGEMDAFVVNSTAIKGLNSTSIAEKLTMVNKDGSF